ncbi:cytochrome P450 9e2 [Bombyx mori]|uniref:unspecific monooxygenase n=1 Tax=Bombyx mori TaxID=7091 RepID=A0A8R2HP84_BOMMO|nr:cytochrome P450 9e2 [Bombyx mori]
MFLETLLLLITIIVGYYWYIYKKAHYYFESKGVKYLRGVPFFGNLMNNLLRRTHLWEDYDVVYKAFPNERYVGFTDGVCPGIFIRDPEIIKHVTVKEFDHFVNNKDLSPEGEESILKNSLIMLKDEKWRKMRAALSPAFTASKMREMVPLITEISHNIVEYLKEHLTEDIDLDDLMSRYSNDVIASAAFGLQINSLKERDNIFFRAGKDVFNFSLFQSILMIFSDHFPSLSKKLGFTIIPKSTSEFFRTLIASTVDYRIKNKVERRDMIQLLMQLSTEWTETELAAQLFVFFVAGFETTGNTLINCIHELALSPHIQDILYEELKAFKETKGNLVYENIGELKYLDCVLNETMRKWSAAIFVDRICTKPYVLPPPREGGKPCQLKPGEVIYNTVNSIHMDPIYYEEPEKFIPERFLDENKHKIKPFTFMPFGVGPRYCIGSRFALMEMKILLFRLMLNFKVLKCAKTLDPIKMSPVGFNMNIWGGSWVKFQARKA